jgi:hypothetical protein
MRVHGTKRASSIVCSIVAGRIRKDCRRGFLDVCQSSNWQHQHRHVNEVPSNTWFL